jgi:hypothetical protein
VKPRPLFYALAVALAVVIWVAVSATTFSTPAPADETSTTPEPPATTTVKVDRTVQGKSADQWHRVAQKYLSRRRSLQRAIRFDPETTTAINLACTVYGHCSELWQKARCESKFWRYARNPSGASGLFQFLPGTWASTPFGRYSVFDPYASSLAAGWMHARGRGGEWVCR